MEARGKNLAWLHGAVKTPPFSVEARIEAGVLLRKLQMGQRLAMPHSEPLRRLGPGCHQLRIRDEGTSWRIVYHVDSDAIVVLEVFEKKTRETPRAIVEVCRRRLSAYKAAAGRD